MAATSSPDGGTGVDDGLGAADTVVTHTPVETPSADNVPGPVAKAHNDDDLKVEEPNESSGAQDEEDDDDDDDDDEEEDESEEEEDDSEDGDGDSLTSFQLEELRKKQAAERHKEREKLMHEEVTVVHSTESVKFFPRTMVEGVVGWTDRTYQYSEVPEELIDAVFFVGFHKKVPAGVFTLSTGSLEGTAYIWSETPANTGGFPSLGWEDAGTMKFAETMTLQVFKQELAVGSSIEIPVQAPWIGGVGFKMAPDEVPEPSEESEEEPEPQRICCVRCFKFLVSYPYVQKLDDLITNHSPVLPLERFVTRCHDKATRRDVERAFDLANAAATGDERRIGRIRGHWLFACLPPHRGALETVTFSLEQVLQVFRSLRPKQRPSMLNRALRGKLPPKAAALALCWRITLISITVLLLHFVLALIVFSVRDLASNPMSGVLTDIISNDPPAAAGATVAFEPLWNYPALPLEELRKVEDVAFAYNQATHVVRVAMVTRTAGGAVVITGADGSTVRVESNGKAYWRQKGLLEVALPSVDELRSVPMDPEVAWYTAGVFSSQALAS